MAEERLIDDDKDRKYKIRKNADGEDELYIDDTPEEEPPEEENVFVAPEEDDDIMTPEQIAAMERMEEEERLRLENLAAECAEKARAAIETGNFHAALEHIAQAEDSDCRSGELCTLKLVALSCNFTDFSRADELKDAADEVSESASDEQKAEIAETCAHVRESEQALQREIDDLSEENDGKKAERRAVLHQRRKKALIAFACVAVPFVVFVVLAAVFGSMIHAVRDSYLNMYLTIIFAALAVVSFVALLVCINRLWTALRNVSLNEKDSSTKLGRELTEKREEHDLLKKISDSLGL